MAAVCQLQAAALGGIVPISGGLAVRQCSSLEMKAAAVPQMQGLSRVCRQRRSSREQLSPSPARAALLRVTAAAVASREVDVEKVVPQADRVLLRLDAVKAQTAGGVLLPSSAAKYDNVLVGEVISAGKEVSGIAKGEKVLVSDLNAYEVDIGSGDQKLVFAKMSDILAIVETN